MKVATKGVALHNRIIMNILAVIGVCEPVSIRIVSEVKMSWSTIFLDFQKENPAGEEPVSIGVGMWAWVFPEGEASYVRLACGRESKAQA